jgi:hypothetical protein
MAKEVGTFYKYRDINFSKESQVMILQAAEILQEYEAAGYVVTLRQLYYQFVARDLFTERWSQAGNRWRRDPDGTINAPPNYEKLSSVVSDGRLAGLLSWTALEDRTRQLQGIRTYLDPQDLLAQARKSYATDLWADQPWRPEVWVEKDALAGVIEGICNKLRVDFFAVRGYNSQSAQWEAGQRMARYIIKGQRPIVFHLGDHDPSGIDMTRDNRDRLELFAGAPIVVARLALNIDQVREINPPPNPAKVTDSRAARYIEEFGDESWELDALEPQAIEGLIEQAVLKIRDEQLWDAALKREADGADTLDQIIEGLK